MSDKFEILTDPNPVLRMPTEEVKDFDLSLQQIIDKMVNSMRADNGIGLAAPQVGLMNKLIVLECQSDLKDPEELKKLEQKGETFPLTVIVNPMIRELSREKCELVEGCLSFPNLRTIIKRPKKVTVSGLDRWGKPIQISACGLFARAIQHENDHLDGILMVDRMRKLKVALMSNMELGLPTMKMLAKNPQYDLDYLICHKKPAPDLARANMSAEAKKLDIPVVFWKSEEQIFKRLKDQKLDLLIVAGFGQILPEKIINLPKYGTLNIHPSLLPAYRGPSPVQQTILDGQNETGVAIIKMVPEVDAGPIIGEMAVKLSGYEDAQVLVSALASIGAEILLDVIPYYVTNDIKPVEQGTKGLSQTKLIRKEDAQILKTDAPETIERKIRAYCGWPYAYTYAGEKRLLLLRSHLGPTGLLILDKVKLEGKREMSFEEFRRGNKESLENLDGKLAN